MCRDDTGVARCECDAGFLRDGLGNCPPAPACIVYVDANNTFRVQTVDWEHEAPSRGDLLRELRDARLGDKVGNIPTKMLVKANEECLHDSVVTALDAGRRVGMEEVQLMTVEGDE